MKVGRSRLSPVAMLHIHFKDPSCICSGLLVSASSTEAAEPSSGIVLSHAWRGMNSCICVLTPAVASSFVLLVRTRTLLHCLLSLFSLVALLLLTDDLNKQNKSSLASFIY